MGDVTAATTGFSGLILTISIVIALVNCFFGYKMQRIWIGLICFFVGVIGGYAICTAVIDGVSTAIALLVGIAFGALLALLSFKLYLVGVFMFAAGISFWACVLLLTGINDLLAIIAGIAVGLLVGFLAVRFTRTVMILSTGISGGLSAFQSLLLLVPVAAVHELAWLPFVGGGVLAVLGIFVQYRTDVRARRTLKEREAAKAARAAARAETAKLPDDVMHLNTAPVTQPAAAESGAPEQAAAMPEPLPLDGTESAPAAESVTELDEV